MEDTIPSGTFLIEYVGELITMDEFKRRMADSMGKNEENFYYMTMDNMRMIDARPKGNRARFINHSCDPNCETQKWTVNGDTRVGIFSKKDIKAGEELTFNYKFETVGNAKEKKACLCGAKNCSGWIGEKPKDQSQLAKNANGLFMLNKKKLKQKMKMKKPKKLWEDLCFRCFEDGELLMCDYKSCPKVYHLACVEREKLPGGRW